MKHQSAPENLVFSVGIIVRQNYQGKEQPFLRTVFVWLST